MAEGGHNNWTMASFRRFYKPWDVEKQEKKYAVPLAAGEYKRRIDPSYVSQEGRTDLHIALYQGVDNAKEIEYIVKCGCDVNAADKNGNQALHIAAQMGLSRSIERLVYIGSHLESLNQDGHTPLMLAARGGHVESANKLLRLGASANRTNASGETALHFAVSREKNKHVIKLLKDAKVRVNHKDVERRTSMHLACKFGYSDYVQLLMEKGPGDKTDPDAVDELGQTPLHYAADFGHFDCVETLLKYSTDINPVDNVGNTPFLRALKNNKYNVVRLLVNESCDRSMLNRQMGLPLTFASFKGFSEITNILLDAGESVNEIGFWGITPLMAATYESRMEVVDILLKRGADPNVIGRSGCSCLTQALLKIQDGNVDVRHRILAKLIRAGSDVNFRIVRAGNFTNITNGRNCPFSFALASGYLSAVKMILFAGCRITKTELDDWVRDPEIKDQMNSVEELCEILTDWVDKPRPLSHICRSAIRSSLGPRPDRNVHKLPLATTLQKFVDFHEFDFIPVQKMKPLLNSPNSIPILNDHIYPGPP